MFEDVPANLSDLTMSEPNWRKVATTFHLPSGLGRDLKRKITKVSSTTHKITKGRNEEGRQSSYVEHLEMHSMVTSDEFTGDARNFALASTHFKKRRLTFVVILGASDLEMKRTKELLEQAEDAIDHPLLGLGLCAELQFERYKRLVENIVDECINITTALERALLDQSEVNVQLTNRVKDAQFVTTGIVEELRAITRHMTKLLPSYSKRNMETIKRKEETEEAKEGETEKEAERVDDQEEQEKLLKLEKTVKQDEITVRFNQRLKDILVEYEALEAKSQRYANNMSATSDIVR